MKVNMIIVKKVGLLIALGGLGMILGWIGQKYEVFFYPPPGIIP